MVRLVELLVNCPELVQSGSFAQPIVIYCGLVNYFRNTDLVNAATGEVQLAIWRGDHVANYAPTGRNGSWIEERLRVRVPKREFMRRGINQHTLEKICRKEPVRAVKFAKCLKLLGVGYQTCKLSRLRKNGTFDGEYQC